MTALAALLFFGSLAGNARAAIALRGTPTTANNSGNTVTISKPSGVVAGDLMIAYIAQANSSGTPTNATSSGWTLIESGVLSTSSNWVYGTVLYRVAGTSDTPVSTYAFNLTPTVGGAVGDIAAFSGVDGVSPFDVAITNLPAMTAVAGGTRTTTVPPATAITTVTANAVAVLLGMAAGRSSGSTAGAWTNWAAGLVEFDDDQGSGTGPNATSVGAALKTNALPGTTGSGSVSLSSSMYCGALWVALRPAGGQVASAANSTVTANPTNVVADGATTSTITVTLKDAANNLVSNKVVTLAESSGPGTPTITTVQGTTGTNGVALFTVKCVTAGVHVFQATDTTDSIVITQTASVTFTPGAVSSNASTVSAAPTSVPANGTSNSTITVTLKDIYTNPVPGKAVTLAKTSGPGTPTITTVQGTSDTNGVATFTVKSTTAGVDVFQATDTTDSIVVTQTVSVTFTPGPVSASVSTVGAAPTTVPADGVSTSTVTVTLLDANSNAVPSKTVTLGSSRGVTDTISAASGPSGTNGVVTFTVKSSTIGSPYFTATNTTDGITITQTATVNFVSTSVASATNSTVTAAPVSIPADGFTLSTITVTLKTTNNSAVAGKTVTLASSRTTNDTISAASGPSDPSGIVTFTVKSSMVGSSAFTATDVTDSVVVTQKANVAFTAAATKLAFTAVPATGTVGVAFSVTVQSQNAGGTPVNVGSPTTITLSKASGGGSLSGTLSGVIGAGSNTVTIATPIYSMADTLTLTATASGAAPLTSATSSGIVFSPGPVSASISTVTASPTNVVADGVTTSTITVTLKDAYSNVVSNKAVTVAKASGPGTPTITTVQGITGTNGAATFTVKSVTAGVDVFQATNTTDNIVITQTASVTFTAGPVSAGASTVIASPTSVPADGVTTSTITVTLMDVNSNAVSGKTVTLGSSRGATDTISAASGPSDASGVVTFTVKSSTMGSSVFTATNTTDSIVVTQTATVTFTGSSQKDILTFGTNYTSTAIIDTVADTVTWNLPAGTSVTSLSPAYTVSPNASGNPVSGTARNFTTPQIYTITAQDGSTNNYTVTAVVAVGQQGYGISLATDVAQEFSPRNRSGHPIFTGLTNYPNSLAPKALAAGAMKAPWANNVGTQTMMCSDCHDSTTTNYVASAAQGPHGSANQFLLRGPNANNWPNVTLSNIGTSWCMNCHNNSAGTPHTTGNHSGYQCYQCHTIIPHGGEVSRLIATRTTGMPARYAWQNNTNNVAISVFRKATAASYAQNGYCNASCYHTSSVTNSPESW